MKGVGKGVAKQATKQVGKAEGKVMAKQTAKQVVKAEVKGATKVLQSGGNTLNSSTLKALGLTKQQGKIAIEGLKKDILIPPNLHSKIMGNGDLVHPNSGKVLGNLFDYLH